MPNDFRPRFQNPVPLPPVDDFRLSTILQRYVPEENEAVKKALLNVTERHQNDLKQEIRRSLTVEQKIQYLNIDVAKRAHLLRRKVASRKRRLEKSLESVNNDRDGSINADLTELVSSAVLVSTQVQGLANQALEYERSKNGPFAGPDPRKYPRLASFFGTGTESVDVDSAESEVVDGYIDNKEQQLQNAGRSETSQSEDRFDAFEGFGSPSNTFQTAFNVADLPQISSPDGSHADLSPDDNELESSSDEEHSAPPSLYNTQEETIREPSPEVTPEMFEQIMDLNISKYRSQRQRKYDELDFSNTKGSESSSAPKNKSNPLRLLYSSSALANSDMLKASTVEEESLKSPFINSKSVATVSPTPQTSLHKKLRIRVQPLRYNKNSDKCSNQECVRGEEKVVHTSPAKAALTQTLYSLQDSAIEEEQAEVSDDGFASYSENVSESDEELSSTSDDVEGTSSSNNPLDITAEEYESFQRELAKVHRKKKSQRKLESPLREFSPTPKHQPSHRTLKPKGSILKITSGSRRRNKMASPSCKQSKNWISSVDGSPLKANSPLPENTAHTPYRASPRASFVNEVSALGMILGSEPPRGEDSDEDNREISIEDDESFDNVSAKSDNRESSDYKSIDRLRSLLV